MARLTTVETRTDLAARAGLAGLRTIPTHVPRFGTIVTDTVPSSTVFLRRFRFVLVIIVGGARLAVEVILDTPLFGLAAFHATTRLGGEATLRVVGLFIRRKDKLMFAVTTIQGLVREL